jgi:hypothetical protein
MRSVVGFADAVFGAQFMAIRDMAAPAARAAEPR